MSAALAIDHFAKTYQRERVAGSYQNGRWVNQPAVLDTIEAAVFAPSAHDVLDLEEGQRTNIAWTIWSRAELRASDETAGTTADRIEVQGKWFRVAKLWPRIEGEYFKALLERDVERNRSVHSTSPVVAGGDWH